MADPESGLDSSDANGGAAETSVKVAVRIRPLVGQEVLHGSRSCLNVVGTSTVLAFDKSFDFDHVLRPDTTQKRAYEVTTRPLIDQFFQGFNATVLAYGQTASGKTFTLGNTLSIADMDESAGIIPRLLKDIFERLGVEKDKNGPDAQQWRLQLSYLEIYQEDVNDLLRFSGPDQDGSNAKAPQDAPLSVRENAQGGVTVAGLTLHEVTSMGAVSELLYRGALCRATASTNMNAHSSRSHAICTLYLESWSETNPQACCRSKFHLVDLAGSERAKRTGAEGERLREGININRGLLALGNVISALTDTSRNRNGKAGHVPYRDSKITRLLQDSLGGNSYTVMIACVSPADENLDETVNTLRYAQRARSIRNMATQNILSRDDGAANEEVQALRRELKAMQLQLIQARSGSSFLRNDPYQEPVSSEVFNVLREENGRLRDTVTELERVAKSASEETMMVGLRLECMRMRCEQLVSLAREGGVDLPAELVEEVEEQMQEEGEGALVEEDEERAMASEAADGLVMDDDEEGGELQVLNEDIRAKEEALASMCREGRYMASLRSFFEGTIERLQTEVKSLQGEREDLAVALNKTQKEGSHADPTVVATMRARERELERKIKDLQAKEASHRRVLQLKAKAETEVQKLRVEIEDAKKRQGALLRKTRQETQKLCKEKRCKELEAVRLKRNESKMKYEFERKLDRYAKHEAVLRRKVEEAAAASQRYQETIKRLTEGRKGKEQQGGFRQQERHRELRKFVEREFEACDAISAARTKLRVLLDRRAEAAMNVAEFQQRLAQGAAGDESSMLRCEMKEQEKEAQELSSQIQQMQKDVLDMEAKLNVGTASLDSSGEDAAGGDDATSTRRWAQIRTLGEARAVLAMLFDKALSSSASRQQEPLRDERRAASAPAEAVQVPTPAAFGMHRKVESKPAAMGSSASSAVKGPLVTAVPARLLNGPARLAVKPADEEDEEEEEEEESSEEESDDSDYDPDNSPSKAHAKKKRGSGGSTGNRVPRAARQKTEKKRISLEDEIDALLSDKGSDDDDDAVPPPKPRLSLLEPLEQKKVSELKVTLKALKLPSTGKKELLVQRIRARLVQASSPDKAPQPVSPVTTETPGARLSSSLAVLPTSSEHAVAATTLPPAAASSRPVTPAAPTATPVPARMPFRDVKNALPFNSAATKAIVTKPPISSFLKTSAGPPISTLLKPAVSAFKPVSRPFSTMPGSTQGPQRVRATDNTSQGGNSHSTACPHPPT